MGPERARLIVAAALACAAVAPAACSRGEKVTPDAGRPTGPPACRTDTGCDGSKIVACSEGLPVGVIADCADHGEVCSLGRCTSRACQAEEQRATPSFLGCLFYTLPVDNVTSEKQTPN